MAVKSSCPAAGNPGGQFLLLRCICLAAVVGLLAASLGLAGAQAPAAPAASPAKILSIDPADSTVLMSGDAILTGALKQQWPHQAARFWVSNWTSNDDAFTWTVRLPHAGNYSVTLLLVDCGKVLIDCKIPSPSPVKIEVKSALSELTYTVNYRNASATNEWVRDALPGTLRLPAGESKITLRALAQPGQPFNLALYSMELVQPSVAKDMAVKAAALKSSTRWMSDAKYGLMFTWTAATYPRTGEKKSYADAVRDFNVNAFADMVAGTGAGFVVFCTSWSTYYFPAPLQTWERVAPSHTTQRDLIRELADALNARGIKLMIYYHAGRLDKDWWSGDVTRKMDKAAYFKEWEDTISEIGTRYGDKLAGWWFDDGLTFYYTLQAPWEAMTRSTKAGNPARVVGYNSWILPRATDFQDFACGEGDFPDRLTTEDELPVGGSGIFLSGPQKGLQATITLTNEGGDWGHVTPNAPIPPPRYSTPKMIEYIQKAVARKDVPVINLEVYEDGSASPQAIEEFKAIKAAIKPATP
jgi:hypothetical protein